MTRKLLLVLTLGLATGACVEGYASQEGEGTVPRGLPEAAHDEPAVAKGAPLLGKDRLHTEEVCGELFAPKDVAAASGLDVDAQEMTAQGKGSCAIGRGDPFVLNLSIFRPKDSVQAALSLFEMATVSVTKAEIDAAMHGVEKRAHERDPSKKVDRERTASIAAMMPTTTFVEVDGIGDRARMTTGSHEIMDTVVSSCTIFVVVRNVVFSIEISTSEEGPGEEVMVVAAKKLATSIGSKIASM